MSNKLVKRKTENEENIWVKFYIGCGKVFVICSACSCLLLGFVSTLPQDYVKYNISLFFGIWFIISFAMLILGLVIIILCKKSKKFQTWAQKDVLSFAERFIHKKSNPQNDPIVKSIDFYSKEEILSMVESDDFVSETPYILPIDKQ